MDRQQLIEKLKELHTELQSSSDLDSEKRELLQKLSRDIEKLLNQKEGEPASGSEGLIGRLEMAALELEASHPATTVIIGKVVDLLVQFGI